MSTSEERVFDLRPIDSHGWMQGLLSSLGDALDLVAATVGVRQFALAVACGIKVDSFSIEEASIKVIFSEGGSPALQTLTVEEFKEHLQEYLRRPLPPPDPLSLLDREPVDLRAAIGRRWILLAGLYNYRLACLRERERRVTIEYQTGDDRQSVSLPEFQDLLNKELRADLEAGPEVIHAGLMSEASTLLRQGMNERLLERFDFLANGIWRLESFRGRSAMTSGERSLAAGLVNIVGLAHMASGNLERAMVMFDRALYLAKTMGGVAEIAFNRGVAYQRAGIPIEALKSLKMALRLKPQDVSFLTALKEVYVSLSMEAEAARAQESIDRLEREAVDKSTKSTVRILVGREEE